MERGTVYKDMAVVGVILAAVGAYFLVSWLRPNSEQEIRGILDRARKASADGNARAFLMELAPDYHGDSSSRDELAKMLSAYFAEYGPTQVRIEGLSLKVEGNIAAADLTINTTAANRDKWAADGAHSVWRLKFGRFRGRWCIESVDPVSFMGQKVTTFAFREELRRKAEADLRTDEKKLASEAERRRLQAAMRHAELRRRTQALLARYPRGAARWTLDDFEDGALAWAPREWGLPCKVTLVKKGGNTRLRVTVDKGDRDKVGLERPIELDMSSRDRIALEVENAGKAPARLAIALKAQGRLGRDTWYESLPQALPGGKKTRLEFSLKTRTFKTQRAKWKHKVRAKRLEGVGYLYLLIYTRRPGVFYIDNVTAERASSGPVKKKARPKRESP